MDRPRALALVACLLAVSAAAVAEEPWTAPFAGVRYRHRLRKDPRLGLHVATVDLTEPGVRLVVSAPAQRRATVSGFAKKAGVQLAVNGDFVTEKAKDAPRGLTISGGERWPGSEDDRHDSTIAWGAGRLEIFPGRVVVKPEPWMTDVLGGHPDLIVDGEPVEHMRAEKLMEQRHPRTAVGLTKDRKTLLLVVVDGRQPHSVGMTGDDLVKVFQELRAWWAVNLDGGGSSAMFVEGLGVVNKPSDGRERPVVNYLGVHAPRGPSKPKGQVEGRVTAKGSKASLARAKVAVTASYHDVTDAKGGFHLSQVPAGEATLTVTAEGHSTARVSVTVKADELATASVELEPEKPANPPR